METFVPYLKECEDFNIPGCLMYHNPIVQPLLRHAHERGIQRPFVEKVMESLGSPLNVMESAGGEALSDREMEVLRVMAEGLGNREIGERLFVSEATVKTHVPADSPEARRGFPDPGGHEGSRTDVDLGHPSAPSLSSLGGTRRREP